MSDQPKDVPQFNGAEQKNPSLGTPCEACVAIGESINTDTQKKLIEAIGLLKTIRPILKTFLRKDHNILKAVDAFMAVNNGKTEGESNGPE
jgi:hypothetical protein